MERRKIKMPQQNGPALDNRRQIVSPASPRPYPQASLNVVNQHDFNTASESPRCHTTKHRKTPKFEERYTRVTTYIENDLHQLIRRLYNGCEIGSMTAFINAALEKYLAENFRQ